MFFYTFIDKITLYCVQTYVYFLFKLRRLFKLKIEVKSKSYVPYSYPSISKSNLDYSNLRTFFKNGIISILAYIYYFKRTFLTYFFFFFNEFNFFIKKIFFFNFFFFFFFFFFYFFFFFFYTLISGFVYFIKKTTFSKYTDVLQRF